MAEPTANDIDAEVRVGWAIEAMKRARDLIDSAIGELEQFPELEELTRLRTENARLRAELTRED